jgi:predicted transcriptional regulator
VPYLSAMMQWSRNTIRRVINTLVELGLVTLKLDGKRITFTRVRIAERVRAGYKQLKSRLFDIKQKSQGKTRHSINKPTELTRPGKKATPAEHAYYLAEMRKAQNY